MRVIEDGGATLIARLGRAEVDLAYVPAGEGRLVGRPVYPIHVVAAVPRRHALGRHREVEVTSLAAWPLLALRRGFGSREWFESACQAANVRPNILPDSGSHDVVLALSRAGYGVGVLPSAVPPSLQGIRLLPIVHRGAPIGRWTMLAWEPHRPLAPYANQFVDEFVRFAQTLPRSQRGAARPHPGADGWPTVAREAMSCSAVHLRAALPIRSRQGANVARPLLEAGPIGRGPARMPPLESQIRRVTACRTRSLLAFRVF